MSAIGRERSWQRPSLPDQRRAVDTPRFPLFRHARGYWAKKVRGKLHYFGKVVDDPDGKAALHKWVDQKDALRGGRTPRVTGDGLDDPRDCADRFLSAKQNKLEAGEGFLAADVRRSPCERD